MSFNPQLQITDAGLAALVNADNDGIKGKIAAIGFGSGPGYQPTGKEVALSSEQERTPILGSIRVAPNQFSVRGRLEPTEDEVGYFIREIGVYLDDGTLLAVWSDPSLAVTGRGPGAGFEFAYLLNLSALPIGSLEIVVTPGGDNVLNALAALTAQGIARERRGLTEFMQGREREALSAARLALSQIHEADQLSRIEALESAIHVNELARRDDLERTQLLGSALTAQTLLLHRFQTQTMIAAQAA